MSENPLNNNIVVQTVVGSAPIAAQTFNGLLLLCRFDEIILQNGEFYKQYSNYAEAVADTANLSATALTRLSTIFSQSHKPTHVVVAPFNSDAGLFDLDIVVSGLTDGVGSTTTLNMYWMFDDGSTSDTTVNLADNAASTVHATAIKDALDAQDEIVATVVGSTVTVTAEAGDSRTLTAFIIDLETKEGSTVALSVVPTLTVDATTTLASLLASDADFYVVTATCTGNLLFSLAPMFTSLGKQCVFAITDLSQTANDYTTVSAYGLTGCSAWYYAGTSNLGNFQNAVAATAASGNVDLTTSTLAYKHLSGVASDTTITSALKATFEANNINCYSGMRGDVVLWNGKNLDGEYFETQQSIDWCNARVAEAVSSLLIAISNRGSKIPYTDSGIQQCAAVVDDVLRRGVVIGHFTEELNEQGNKLSPRVIAPRRADVAAADITNRMLRLSYTATLTNAINKMNIQGYLKIAV